MRKYIIFLLLLVAGITSCRKEDALTPSGISGNYFEVSDDSTDPTDVIRREFFKKTGVYLIFTDTLRHERLGTDGNGRPYYFTELVDLGYAITANSRTYYDFRYITSLKEKEDVALYLENQLLPLMTKKPYSILVTKQLYQNEYLGDDLYNRTELVQFDGFRCHAFAMNHIESIYDEIFYSSLVEIVKTDARIQTFLSMVNPDNQISSTLNVPGDFNYDNYFNEPVRVLGYDTRFMTYIQVPYSGKLPLFYLPYCWEKGYMSVSFTEDPYGDFFYACIGSSDAEIREFIKLIKTMSASDFEAKYGKYEYLMQKYHLMGSIMTDQGL